MTLASKERPELLAPAGGHDALRAAVAAGADAVYLGLDELNARRGADNFTRSTLEAACRFAHLFDVKVYLTVNVVILPNETDQALELIDDAWVAGVDAVIVQDIGLLRLLRVAMPHVRMHASTQLNTHSSDSVVALTSMGVSRITLARETSIQEVATLAHVAAETGVEVESFAHGALCVCYSGQCLLSSLIGGRSANRGLCAQPCRLPYELVDEAGAVLADVGAHLLSPKDLASITVLPELVAAGASAIKLEGRMKGPDYVALVTGVYRAALDRAVELGDSFEVREGELSVLAEAFSRGFTEAYLTGERGNKMMSYRRPNNRGVPIGRIATVRGDQAEIVLDTSLDAEDTIEVWTSQGRFAQSVGPLSFGGGAHTAAPSGAKVAIRLEGKAATGDRVFRVRNAALSKAAGRMYSEKGGRDLPLSFEVSLAIGKRASVAVTDEQGRRGVATGDEVEAARTKAVGAEEVIEHVGRLGGTPYRASGWDVELSPNAGIGFSELHRLRREAIEDYEAARLAPWDARRSLRSATPSLPARPSRRGSVALVASAADLSSAQACLEAGADFVHVPSWALEGDFPDAVVPYVSRICHDGEASRLYAPALASGRAVAGTLGALRALSAAGVSVEAHWSLNAVNPFAVAELSDLGAAFVWLSPELSARQVAEVAARSPLPVGIAVVGRQELMVTEHCVLMAEGPCAERCEACDRRRSTRFLVDRKGYRFPVVTDASGRTHLYNSIPLDLTASIAEVLSTSVAAIRVDVEEQRPADAARLVQRAREALQAATAGRTVSKPREPVTSGHFFRGVR